MLCQYRTGILIIGIGKDKNFNTFSHCLPYMVFYGAIARNQASARPAWLTSLPGVTARVSDWSISDNTRLSLAD